MYSDGVERDVFSLQIKVTVGSVGEEKIELMSSFWLQDYSTLKT